MHFRRGHAFLALLLWAAHLVVAVWHGTSADHQSCAPGADPVAGLQAVHATCAADDCFAGAAPAVDRPSLGAAVSIVPLAVAAPASAPSRPIDVLAFAPKASPPASR